MDRFDGLQVVGKANVWTAVGAKVPAGYNMNFAEVEELFGWRIDDDGARRPLLVIDPSTGQVRKLVGQNRTGAIDVALGGRH